MQHIYLMKHGDYSNICELGTINESPENIFSQNSGKLRSLYQVDDCEKIKKIIKKEFKKMFAQKKEYGTDYFAGNDDAMDMCMHNILKRYNAAKITAN